MDNPDSTRPTALQIDEPPAETLTRSRRSRCYFFFPCFGRSASSSSPHACGPAWWRRIRDDETNGGEGGGGSLWARGVGALKKIREWSEVVAGPRWKTFIRRFNRDRASTRTGNFQYDPLSYAMNFDEGREEEGGDGYIYGSRNFSSRYAKGSMDLATGGPTFA